MQLPERDWPSEPNMSNSESCHDEQTCLPKGHSYPHSSGRSRVRRDRDSRRAAKVLSECLPCEDPQGEDVEERKPNVTLVRRGEGSGRAEPALSKKLMRGAIDRS